MSQNIAETFQDVVGLYGDRIGVIEAKTGKSVTFGELNDRADDYATYLAHQGVKPGERVILMVTPSADFISLTFALFKVGVTVIMIDPGMGYKNLLRCIERVKPTVFVGVPKARLFSKLFPGPFASVKHWFCCGNTWGILGADIRVKAKGQANNTSFPVYSPSKEDLAAIIFTTGSTGPPKGVRYEHHIFASQLKRVRDYYGIDEKHIDQPAFPLFGLFSAALGACSVIPDMDPSRPAQVNPEKFIESIRRHGVTYSFGSPAIWNVVSRYCLKKGIVLEGLQKVLMAGAPVPGELLQRVRSILPEKAEIYTPYGATESLPIVSIESKEILAETWQKSRQGLGTCVGRPLPGIDIAVMQITEGVVEEFSEDLLVATGEIGEIIVRGDVVTRAYENNIEETRKAKINDDGTFWHRMGDTGYLDEEGRLWFCGRKAHRVTTENGTMFTIPCEAVINEHPDVYRSALVGIPADGKTCLQPVLIVEPNKDFNGNEEQLLREVRQLAVKNHLTEIVSHFLVHRNFPVDIRHNAKIFREKLALWAEQKIHSS